MGSYHLLLLSSPPIRSPIINPRKTPPNPNISSNFRSYSSSRPNWDPKFDAYGSTRFDFDDDFRREKRRNWWSDDDDDDDDEEEDDDDDDEFGFLEEPSSFDLLFKVLRAFGWMIPAVIMSMLLGTGTNSLIMAVVLPLGQTALSLVMDKLWEGRSSIPNPGSRSRRKPSPRNRSRTERNPFAGADYKYQRTAAARRGRTRTSPERGDYQSWRAARSGSAGMGGQSRSKFGGWDELDEQVGSESSFSREEQSREVYELQQQDTLTGKLTRRRNREKPLFMRLLFAVFPFLGSWTRFLF